jgi:hypothetical protein
MKTYIKSGVLAGVVLFFWGAFSWMALPWHTATLHHFIDGRAVSNGLIANALQSGIYVTPMDTDATSQGDTKQAFIFASVHLQGMPSSMVPALIISLLIQIIAAILIAYLLSKTSGLTYFKRVRFVLIFALAAGIITYLPYWNWFCFDTTYTLVMIADLLLGWLLAGLVLAKFNKQ